MSTNCRTLDDMTEPEAIEYVKLLIERVKRQKEMHERFLAQSPDNTLFRDSAMLDEAVLEVLNRLVANS